MGGEWVEMPLWEIAYYINGRTTKPSELCQVGVPVIKIAELNRGITDKTARIPANLVDDRHWVNEGDLLFAWSGSVGVYRYKGPRAALNQHIFRVTAKPIADQLFFYYLLLSCIPIFNLRVQDKRTTMGHITKKDLQNIKVLLPPLPEQRAIAHILGTLDDKIELNRRMNETLEAMAQALFKSWFVDFDPVVVNALKAGNPIPDKFAERAAHYRDNPDVLGLPEHILRLFPDRFQDSELGPIPEGWEIGPLSTIANLRTETIVPRREPEAVWEHYSIPAFDEGRMPKLERGIDIKSGKYKVPPTAVLASKLNPQFPRVWLPDVVNEARAICSTEFMPFVPIKAEWRSLLYELLKSDLVQEGIRSAATGSTGSRQRVKPKTVASMPMIVAPAEILDAFCDRITSAHNLVLSNERESRTLAALRDTLLPKLISGELRVPDVEKILENG